MRVRMLSGSKGKTSDLHVVHSEKPQGACPGPATAHPGRNPHALMGLRPSLDNPYQGLLPGAFYCVS